MLSLNDMFGQAFAKAGAQAPAPQQQPIMANANPQMPPPAAGSAPSSALSSLFPNFDVSQGFNPGYMQQFAAPGGGYGGDSGQYYDNGYQIKGSDGKMWGVTPDFGGRGGYTFTSSDPLDNHNRYSLSFDASGNQTDNQNWKDKSWFDDNKGIIGVLGAAAGGYAAWGGTGAGAGVGEGAVGATGTGAVSSPVYGATAVGTPLTGASPGVVGAGGAAAGGGAMAGAGGGGITGNPIIDKALGSAASSAISSGIGSAFNGSGGGSGGGGLGGILSGGYDYYAQNKAANNMLDWMKSQQGKIDNIYDPNGPVAKMMYDKMQAQDAAAGRNSQYGVRTNNFLGQFGGDYAKYTAALTQGLAGNYQNAYNKQASAGTGLATGIGNAIGSGVNSGLQNMFTQNMSSTVANNGAYSAGGQTYNNPSAYGGSTPYQYDDNEYYPTIY